jgi:RNA polymerase sigma-70 factor (ECF subfamily)
MTTARPATAAAGHEQAGGFATTRWSLVAALARRGDSAAVSLTELCVRYWYPVYAYVRRCGHAPAEAQERTGSFFAHLIASGAHADAVPRKGRFRIWLLDRLSTFLATDAHRSSGSGAAALDAAESEAEFEERLQADASIANVPDLAFQRSFALEVLTLAFNRLRREAQSARRAEMFAALEPFLYVDPSPGRYEEIAVSLGMQPLAVVMAVKRLRDRYRELVDAELADTVSTRDDLRAEREVLRTALVQPA